MGLLAALKLPPTAAMREAKAAVPAKTITTSTLPPIGGEIGHGNFGGGAKKVPGGIEVSFKYEPKLTLMQRNFQVWVVPCFLRVQVKATIEVGGEWTDKTKEGSVSAKGTGVAQIGPGGTAPEITVGFYGAAELSGEMKVPLTLKGAQEFFADPFIVDIYGTGKLGMTFELEDSWGGTAECELARWHLAVVNVGAYENGKWGPVSVSPGKDIDRIVQELQKIGPTVADAVDRYAPEAVKKAAESGARWAAESERAKGIAEDTGKVLEGVKAATGVDLGAGAEKAVQFLADPGGETGAETTARIAREAAIQNASAADFHRVVVEAGLFTGGPLESRTPADVEDYNRILAVKQAEDDLLMRGQEAPGAWRQMVIDLAAKRAKAYKAQQAAAAHAAARQKEADAAAVADLASRVQKAEAEMQKAWTLANYYGNPLNKRTQDAPDSPARQKWTQGMLEFFNKGVKARKSVAALQGEARIAKAQEAATLFSGAAQVFREGMRLLG